MAPICQNKIMPKVSGKIQIFEYHDGAEVPKQSFKKIKHFEESVASVYDSD